MGKAAFGFFFRVVGAQSESIGGEDMARAAAVNVPVTGTCDAAGVFIFNPYTHLGCLAASDHAVRSS